MNLPLSFQAALRVSRPGEITLLGRLRRESLTAFSILNARARKGTDAVADHRLFPFCTDESTAVLFDLQSLDLSACALSATMLTQEGATSFAVISVSRNRQSAIVILTVKKAKRRKQAIGQSYEYPFAWKC
jgi:hypothetical protein